MKKQFFHMHVYRGTKDSLRVVCNHFNHTHRPLPKYDQPLLLFKKWDHSSLLQPKLERLLSSKHPACSSPSSSSPPPSFLQDRKAKKYEFANAPQNAHHASLRSRDCSPMCVCVYESRVQTGKKKRNGLIHISHHARSPSSLRSHIDSLPYLISKPTEPTTRHTRQAAAV